MMAAMKKAARGLVRDFGEVEQLQVSRKGPGDFVTNADLKAERILREELAHARPKFGFVLEEGGRIEGENPDTNWIIDPLDGTTNFMHGLPHFATSVALEVNGELVAGAILDPVKDEFFWAEKGQGAYLNDRRMRVSGRGKLDEAVLATGVPHQGRGDHPKFLVELERMMPQVAGVRRFGAAALDMAYVAAGRYDGFWERGLSTWDIAAGIVLVREAGGLVGELDGKGDPMQTGNIVASNDRLHYLLATGLRKAGRAKAIA